MQKAKIVEIFPSIQGEGIYAGKEQIFIRFYGCNLSFCSFCDTRPFRYTEYGGTDLLKEALRFKGGCHSVSITGGEPLIHADFLKEFLPALRKKGRKVYLETNGTLPKALREVIDFIDIIAMDFKLPSSTGLKGFWGEHRAFLNIALAKEVFVKAVITSDTSRQDVRDACKIITETNSEVPFVLQPVTPAGKSKRPMKEALDEFRDMCLGRLKTVEIIPQLHGMAGIR